MSSGVIDVSEPATEPLTRQPAWRLPLWVRASDVLATLLLVVALAVVIGGGFRARVGMLRLSVTSPLTPVLVALLLLGVRHALHRRPHVVDHFRARLAALVRWAAWRAAWPPFVATRVGLPVVGLLAVHLIGYPPGEPRFRIVESELLNLPMRWDAGWYYSIARVGYYWDRRARQQNVAFFPAYPMSMRGVARLFGGGAATYVLAGVAVSHAAFLCSLLLLYQLARGLLGEPEQARAAVLLTASYPFSIYHGGVYTESLFLLGVVGAMLECHRGRWARAVPWGLLVGLTRPNGFLLAAPLAIMAAGAWRTQRRDGPADARRWLGAAGAAVVAPIAGVAIYSLYIGSLTGNPLAWAAQHAAWGRTFQGTAPIAAMTAEIARVGPAAYLAAHPYEVINGAAAVAALALVIPVGRRLGLAYAVFVAVNLLPPLLMGGTMSMGRLTATMFPLFLWLAAAAPRQAAALAVAFALLQGFAAVLFYTWRPLT